MAGSSTKLIMEIFMTTNNAVLNLNPYIPFFIQPLILTRDLGGTVADRCPFNEAITSVRTRVLSSFGTEAYTHLGKKLKS